jgi:hypothetical protein
MLTLRTLAIVITGAGVFAGLPSTNAQACDDDRYPSSREDQPLNDESRDQTLVATAAAAWPVVPNTEDAGASAPGATGVDATEAGKANAVQVVDPNEVNELDRAAAATVPAESSWITYLLLILGAAPAAGIGHVVLFQNDIRVRAPSSKSAHAHE